MSTKAQLQTAIENALETPITKIEHVAAEVLVLDNLYPTSVLCNNLPAPNNVNGILTPVAGVNARLEYVLRFRKRGNTTFVEGTIANKTNAFINGTIKLADINNSEYNNDTATNVGANYVLSQNDLGIEVVGSEVRFRPFTITGIAPNQTVVIKGFYHNPI